MKKKGFTLIEMLVVIAIIGLLATLILVNINRAAAKARDSRRLAEIKQIQNALAMYYVDHNAYPISGNCGSTSPSANWCNSIQSLSNDHWIRNGTSDLSPYIKQDPTDPNPVSVPNWAPVRGGTYFYYSNTGQWYMIVFGLEQTSHPFQAQDGVTDCGGTYYHYGNGVNGIITVGASCSQY